MPAQVAADDSLIGIVLADKFRIVRQIGRGGMGVVYEAEHMQLGKRVAIKLMLEKYADDTEAIARFQREALAATRIGNPHIIEVIDIGEAPDGRSFVVMELLNGLPLTQVLEMGGPMQPWRAIGIMRQVLRAVGAAHAKGIVHRDLKPDNIFLVGHDDQHDFVKLLDFGISKVMDPDEQVAFTKLTSTGVVMGTPLYMAPEQAMGQHVDAGADIYACGVILYQLLAGRPPFEGQTYAVLVAKLLTQQPEYLANLRPGLPLALVNAVHRALEKEPHRRFPSAEQFAAALPGDRTPSQLELAGTLDSGIAVARIPTLRTKRRPWLAVGGALALGVATAGVLIATQTGAGTEATPPKQAAPAPKLEITPLPTPPPRPAPVQSGVLEVKTQPIEAKVFVGGADVGKSPLTATLAPGRHTIKVELAGFEPVEMEIEIRPESTTAVVVPLAKSSPVAASKKKPAAPPKAVTTTIVTKPVATAAKGGTQQPIDLSALKPTASAKTIKADAPVKPKDDDVPPPKNVKQPPPQTGPTGAKPNPY